MKLKELKDLKQFDVVCADSGYDIVLYKCKEYVMLATYIVKKELIDVETVKILTLAKDEIYFSVIDNIFKKTGKNQFEINGNDVKIMDPRRGSCSV